MITAENIPADLTVIMTGFSNPLSITLPTGSTSDVVISGHQNFISGVVNTSSNVILNISRAGGGLQPDLRITNTGILTSDGDLTINAHGNVINSGQVQAINGTLALQSFSPNAVSVQNTGQMAGNNLFIQTVSANGSGGSIVNGGALLGKSFVSLLVSSLGADIINGGTISTLSAPINMKAAFGNISGEGTITGSDLSLSTGGTGNISLTKQLTASSITLASQFGSIGSALSNLLISSPVLTVTNGADAFIKASSSVILVGAITTNSFNLIANGVINVLNFIGGGNSVALTTAGNNAGNIVLNDNVNANNSVVLSAGGNGAILAPGNSVSPIVGQSGPALAGVQAR